MRRFDTVLFDLDGTLLDTLEDICGAANHTLRELGHPERTLAEMRRFVGNGAEMQMRRALGADADEETVAKALALYKPYYAAHCQIKTKPYAGVLELMAALKAEGFRLAVVSNKPDEAVRPLVAQRFGADGTFDAVVFGIGIDRVMVALIGFVINRLERILKPVDPEITSQV